MRAYDGHATTTIASAALKRPRPRTAATTIARMIGGKANTRSVEPHEDAVDEAAEVAGHCADDAADRRGDRDEGNGDRQRHARAVDDAREDVTAKLVRSEEMVE